MRRPGPDAAVGERRFCSVGDPSRNHVRSSDSAALGADDLASQPWVEAVAACDRRGRWYRVYPGYGGGAGATYNRFGPAVALSAPGEPRRYGGRVAADDSSQAAALAAAAAARVLGANRELRAVELRALLALTADVPPVVDGGRGLCANLFDARDWLGHSLKLGYGVVNARAACLAAADPICLALLATRPVPDPEPEAEPGARSDSGPAVRSRALDLAACWWAAVERRRADWREAWRASTRPWPVASPDCFCTRCRCRRRWAGWPAIFTPCARTRTAPRAGGPASRIMEPSWSESVTPWRRRARRSLRETKRWWDGRAGWRAASPSKARRVTARPVPPFTRSWQGRWRLLLREPAWGCLRKMTDREGSLETSLPRRVRPVVVLLGLGLGTLTVVAALNAQRAQGRPFAGLLTDAHGSFSAIWWPTWGAERPPLRFPDWLLAIEGAPVPPPATRFELPTHRIAARLAALGALGRHEVHLGWATRQGPLNLTRELRRLGVEETLFFFGLYALVGLFVLWSGLAVLTLAGRRAGALAYAGWSVGIFIFLVTFYDYHSTARLAPLFSLSTVWLQVCLIGSPTRSPSRPGATPARCGAPPSPSPSSTRAPRSSSSPVPTFRRSPINC